MNLDYSITFACLNQLSYTKRCVESLLAAGVDLEKVVVVDNASSDGTQEYLASLPLGANIKNKRNLGCGTAWNQGILSTQAEWTIIMNNDVIVSKAWLKELADFCGGTESLVISPAMIEGDELDYDLNLFASQSAKRVHQYVRKGYVHAVCLMVHTSVWQKVGYFRSKPSLIGYEDSLFFRDLDRHNISRTTIGSSWIHHFGSITQKAMKSERGLTGRQPLGDHLDPELRNESWFRRKMRKWRETRRLKTLQNYELSKYGMTLLGVRKDGETTWV
jgi:glycosyltransferase involved in cell wall biosynthesis